MGWTEDAKSVWVFRARDFRRKWTGSTSRRESEALEGAPPCRRERRHGSDCTVPTPDGKYYVYTYIRRLSDLYVAEGLK